MSYHYKLSYPRRLQMEAPSSKTDESVNETAPDATFPMPALAQLMTSGSASPTYPLLYSGECHEKPPPLVADKHTPGCDDGSDSENEDSESALIDSTPRAPPFNPDSNSRGTARSFVARVMKFDTMLTIALDMAFFVMACVVADRVRASTSPDGLIVACIVFSIVTCIANMVRAAFSVAVIVAARRMRRSELFWRLYNVYYFWTLVLSLAVFVLFGLCVAAIPRDPQFSDSMVMLAVMNIVFRAILLLLFFFIPITHTKWFRRLWASACCCCTTSTGSDMF